MGLHNRTITGNVGIGGTGKFAGSGGQGTSITGLVEFSGANTGHDDQIVSGAPIDAPIRDLPTPEPPTFVLAGFAGVGLLFAKRHGLTK